MSSDDLVPVAVSEIRVSAWSSQRVMVLRAGDDRALPIWIGQSEADSIALALRGESPARPITHDLALHLLTPLGTQLTRVVIHKILNQTFYAEITLTTPEQTYTLDARPSDALALAVRAGTPVFVSQALFEACAVTEEQTDARGFTIQREPAPPPFGPPTLHYIGQLATAAGQTLDEPEAIQWGARAVELDGATYTSIRLPGESERRLLMEAEMWEVLQNKIAEFAEGRRKLLALLAARTGDTIEPTV
jgi:bifunctional DNase/RNase